MRGRGGERQDNDSSADGKGGSGSTGALAEPSPDEVALEHLARAVPPGRTAVVAEVAESDPGLVDEALAGVSAWIVRRPLADVEAELGAARDAVAAAGEEARRVLRGIGPNPG